MKQLRHIISLMAAILYAASLQAQEVKSTTISGDTLTIGDHLLWKAIFTVPQNEPLAAAPYSEVLKATVVEPDNSMVADSSQMQRPFSLGDRVEVLSDLKLDTLSIKRGMVELEASILLTSFDSGEYKLPQPLVLLNEDTLQFGTPSFVVRNVGVDTTGFEVRELKGVMKYPITFGEVFPWVLLGLGIIALIALVVRFIIYRRENKDFFGRSLHKDPPHIVALRKLERIRGEKLWQNGKEKQFYTGITDTLRTYIESRYDVSAMEKTSREILEELKGMEIEERVYDKLGELFQLSDLVKFAKYTPGAAENEEAIPTAVSFVNSTFMQTLEAEKEEK